MRLCNQYRLHFTSIVLTHSHEAPANRSCCLACVMLLLPTYVSWSECLMSCIGKLLLSVYKTMCGRTFEEELERIDEVFHRFRRVNLKLNPKKCWTCGKQWKGEDWPWKGGCCEDVARTEKTRMCEASLDSALDTIDPWRPLPALPYLSISFVVKE